MNPGVLSKNSNSLIKIPKQQNHQSPSFKRIVNIYSVNTYKKKKYILSSGSVSNQASNHYNILPTTTSNSSIPAATQAYKGPDDIRTKLQQLREGLGYYN